MPVEEHPFTHKYIHIIFTRDNDDNSGERERQREIEKIKRRQMNEW